NCQLVSDVLWGNLADKHIKKYWWVIIIATIVMLSPQLKTEYDLFKIGKLVEDFLETSNEEDWVKTNPPIPININDSIVYSQYLNNVDMSPKYSVDIFTGPAGAGKSIIRRKLIKELHFLGMEPIVIRLNKLGIKKPQSRLGNDAKFTDLSSFLADCPSLRLGLSKYLAQNIGKYDKEKFDKYFTNKSNEIFLVLDDFDEIDFNSRKSFLDDIYIELKNSQLEKVRIFILSRAEAIIEVGGINELHELSISSPNFRLDVHNILPFYSNMNSELHQEYIKNSIKWGGKEKYELVFNRLNQRQEISDSIISDFTKWIDGANIVANYFASEEYIDNDSILRDNFGSAWRERAIKTHKFPDYSKSNNYCIKSKRLMSEIPTKTEILLSSKYKPLFYSGLIELVPVSSSLQSSMLKRQFENLDSFCDE
ncbi:MAG: hypothetical protein ACPG6V_09575, partial [Flavobacteriales bacterium]